MFLIIFRISVQNVLKMFINIIVGIVFAVVVFHSYKPTGTTNTLYTYRIGCYAGRQERNMIILNTYLYMHNAIGDAVLTNICREIKSFRDLLHYQKLKNLHKVSLLVKCVWGCYGCISFDQHAL